MICRADTFPAVSTPTVIPPQTIVDGSIDTADDLIVEGRCHRDIIVAGTLVDAAGACCKAMVKARNADIHGEVIGDIVCTGAISVGPGARIVGNLRAPDITVDASGELDGKIDLLPPEPEVHTTRRISVLSRGPELRRPTPPPRTKIQDS